MQVLISNVQENLDNRNNSPVTLVFTKEKIATSWFFNIASFQHQE